MGFAIALLLATPAAAQQAQKPANQATPADYAYLAQRGDTLIGVAARLLIKPADWVTLQKKNRIADPRRLVPGSVILIPVHLLRMSPLSAEVVSVRGDAKDGAGSPLKPGQTLGESTALATGRDGFVTLRLKDGSLLTIQNDSRAELVAVREQPALGLIQSIFRLVRGRTEALVAKLRPGSRFEVNSELAVAGVRGTLFRTGAGEAAFQSEVLEGNVVLAGKDPASAVALAAGQGSRVDQTGVPSAPVALLPPPVITPEQLLQERLVLRVRFPALPGALAYRAQLALDRDFQQVIAQDVFKGSEAKFNEIADGAYFVRVRGVDALGLEGKDAVAALTMKARPEPPFTQSPQNKGKVRATQVEFAWGINPDAARYRLELSDLENFSSTVERVDTDKGAHVSKQIPFGKYYWRIRSIKTIAGSDDLGPWSDTQSFDLRPPPAAPEPPTEGAGKLGFGWSGEPGQKFEFQFARDDGFKSLLADQKLEEAKALMERPNPGIYFVRIRATDPDGFVGPFTKAQRIEIINRVTDLGGATLNTGFGTPVLTQ